MSCSNKEAGSITLPEDVFRNLQKAKRFAIDIGGSLTKIAYYSTVSYKRALYSLDENGDSQNPDDTHYEVIETDVEAARLHFIKFETKHIESCLRFIQKNLIGSPDFMRGKSIKATGGGAYKYTDVLTKTLGLMVDKENEMECLIKGCNFVLKNIPDEVFEYSRNASPEYHFHSVEPNMYPYLLVNIGSGVSIMLVESESSYERIGGSAMGGGTFWGLGSLLTKAKGFDELLELAEKGDHRGVDMLVKDIYGGDCSGMGLPGDLIACSFGKAIHSSKDKDFNPGQFAEPDIARSLLFMISNDIGQIACLYAMMHNLGKVYFGGYFLRAHYLSMHTISFAINYWSKGKVQALFLRHEGYLAAIGAFLTGAEEYDTDKYSWCENYAGSSGLSSPLPAPPISGQFADQICQMLFENNVLANSLSYAMMHIGKNRLNLEVAQAMETHGTDLVVFEGMGRAVHTNLNAEFKCECIKAAVLKNQWLCHRLGGEMYSVIFKYEIPPGKA
ncbi:4'-phosphopantetheine phosphatase like protein [Argiope bruennichi]|uniref:4'-phosphopantetheine phosphatase like protein n=1 Tax=Argiope bruennichi TaxID=94029 RepID=A0A8T0EW99_ARGBR|nr:4'-phosphopantetheine phosphatase like protein [Argiope bruennichi]